MLTRGKYAQFLKKKVFTSDKITPSEEVEKGTNILNDTENPVIMIRRKDSDKFHGQSTV